MMLRGERKKVALCAVGVRGACSLVVLLCLPVLAAGLAAEGYASDAARQPARGGAAACRACPMPGRGGRVSQSLYIPDACIQPHPRFPTLTANIRQRRGQKVMITVPVYPDTHTDETMRQTAPGAVPRDARTCSAGGGGREARCTGAVRRIAVE